MGSCSSAVSCHLVKQPTALATLTQKENTYWLGSRACRIRLNGILQILLLWQSISPVGFQTSMSCLCVVRTCSSFMSLRRGSQACWVLYLWYVLDSSPPEGPKSFSTLTTSSRIKAYNYLWSRRSISLASKEFASRGRCVRLVEGSTYRI